MNERTYKVICINNNDRKDKLKLNTIYKARGFGSYYFIFYQHGGGFHKKNNFKTIEEFRENNIDTILKNEDI